MAPLSPRLQMIVDALPLLPGMRVLEIGCGPGAAARAVAGRVEFVLGIDRSAKAIRLATEHQIRPEQVKRVTVALNSNSNKTLNDPNPPSPSFSSM